MRVALGSVFPRLQRSHGSRESCWPLACLLARWLAGSHSHMSGKLAARLALAPARTQREGARIRRRLADGRACHIDYWLARPTTHTKRTSCLRSTGFVPGQLPAAPRAHSPPGAAPARFACYRPPARRVRLLARALNWCIKQLYVSPERARAAC